MPSESCVIAEGPVLQSTHLLSLLQQHGHPSDWGASDRSPLTLLLLGRTPASALPAGHSLLPSSMWLQQLLLPHEIAQKLNCHNVQKGSDR